MLINVKCTELMIQLWDTDLSGPFRHHQPRFWTFKYGKDEQCSINRSGEMHPNGAIMFKLKHHKCLLTACRIQILRYFIKSDKTKSLVNIRVCFYIQRCSKAFEATLNTHFYVQRGLKIFEAYNLTSGN